MVPYEVYFAIGQIIGVSRAASHAKKKHKEEVKKEKAEYEIAKKEYDDCHSPDLFDILERAFTRQQEILSMTQQQYRRVASLEKYFKKLRHEFKEKYPEHIGLLDEYQKRQGE